MNKGSIKNYAIWARNELIQRVTQRAYEYGVEKDNIIPANEDSIRGKILTNDEKSKRRAFINEINQKSYDQVIEEVAYTWFNRFIALRFMEVNNYLPNKVRVFTNENNEFKPQILDEALNVEIPGLDKRKVFDLYQSNNSEELYKELLLATCNDMHQYLPGMFETIDDYKVLLFPNNLLRESSVLGRLISDIDEDSWTDQVQIIGWLYQYYNTEPKDKTFADLKKNIKINKDTIPSATQLFTPDWIVRYMTENSLGRLWLDGHEDKDIKSNWKYYLDEAEQEPEVQIELNKIKAEHAKLKPEDIKFIDPCMGSGHILVYAFDVLMQIYVSEGWTEREAAKSILKNNLYGLDIDKRAYQLSYFALMMKARQYNRKILSAGIIPNVMAIEESNNFNRDLLVRFGDELKPLATRLIETFIDAKEYGSILNVEFTEEELNELDKKLDEIYKMADYGSLIVQAESYELVERFEVFLKQARIMSSKYDCVVTNPPYMEVSSGTKKLITYVNEYYLGGKTDMFAVFIEKAALFGKKLGYIGMITQPSLTSLVSFEQLRLKLFTEKTIQSVLHMGRGVFGIDFGSFAFVYENTHIENYYACYFKLHERTFQYINPDDIRDIFICAKEEKNYKVDFNKYDTSTGISGCTSLFGSQIFYISNQDKFLLVPGSPFAYTMTDHMIDAYSQGLLSKKFITREGMATAGNDTFLRLWYEVDYGSIGFDCDSSLEAEKSGKKWFPYNKGGDYRKWYGNNDYVVDWENNGERIRNNIDPNTGRVRSHNYNGEFAFKKGLTWSSISAGDISIRWSESGFLFDSKGAKGFAKTESEMYSIMGFLNSSTAMRYLKVISPTMDFKVGDIIQLPLNNGIFDNEELQILVKRNIVIAKNNWDSKETSWNFRGFVTKSNVYLKNQIEVFANNENDNQFELKNNEERINLIISSIYGLTNDTNNKVSDNKLSIQPTDVTDYIKQLISYAVGCMFGRYSLDTDGLAYAGGEWDSEKYKSFIPDNDNIIPICDDEYFEDDIVHRFVEFIKVAYGEDTLEENLQFIASVLGGTGTPREIIRNYFLNDFFKDHCNTYQVTGSGKRPIYWQFDSGKKNGFKALMYIHRYTPDLIARMRTSYIHELQSKYTNQISMTERQVESATSTSERVKIQKRLTKFKEQEAELRKYEELVHHWADKMEPMDLDDGVKVNYARFQELLAKIK